VGSTEITSRNPVTVIERLAAESIVVAAEFGTFVCTEDVLVDRIGA